MRHTSDPAIDDSDEGYDEDEECYEDRFYFGQTVRYDGVEN